MQAELSQCRQICKQRLKDPPCWHRLDRKAAQGGARVVVHALLVARLIALAAQEAQAPAEAPEAEAAAPILC